MKKTKVNKKIYKYKIKTQQVRTQVNKRFNYM